MKKQQRPPNAIASQASGGCQPCDSLIPRELVSSVSPQSNAVKATATDETGSETAFAGPLLGEDRHPVDVLAEEYAARWRNGETPSIEEYEQRAPEHQALIRTLFPTIATIERMSQGVYSARPTKRLSLIERKFIGDFRIIREIGRGGMGIVYEAIQQSLERRVALKVLGSGISNSPQQLQRFRREAESAARLHHTHIVPVYGIGEEDGVHFYAMQYIDGIPLANAIETVRDQSLANHTTSIHEAGPSESFSMLEDDQLASRSSRERRSITSDATILMSVESQSVSSNEESERTTTPSFYSVEHSELLDSASDPTAQSETSGTNLETAQAFTGFLERRGSPEYFRRIANMAAQVADALDYAHRHGVLHRDIKPSNLMLDRNGSVWIMDFGLVKNLEQHDLTQVGEIVGTLRYMAPEQLDGRADPTTDVYGLGLTLFELLTFQPAFDGDQTITLAQRLQHTEIPRPRSINPAIPRDLETIVLKATVSEPSSRYQSAAMLAEDLRRFSEDRTIFARRATYLERLWRWSRRNPALAVATGSTILLLGLIAIVATVGKMNVESALLDAKKSQQRAEANLDSAINAFDSILDNVKSRGLPRSLAFNIPQAEVGLTQTPLSAADALLLDKLLKFYRTFASQNVDNRRLRSRIADAHERAGAILVRLGRLTEAEEDFRLAIALFAKILESDPHNVEALVNSSALYNEIGELLLRRGEFRQTSNSHLEARAILLEQPASVRSEPSIRFELARATDLFASIDIRSGTNEGPGPPPTKPAGMDSPGRPRRSNRSDSEDPMDRPPPPEHNNDRLKRALPPAMSSNKSNPMSGLALVLLEASDEFRSLTKEFPDNAEYQFRLAQCLRHRLVHATTTSEPKIAREAFLEAVQILDRLTVQSPNEPRYLFELADTLTQASRAQSDLEAKESLEHAVAIAKQLATRFPTASEYQLLLGTALARQAANQSAFQSTDVAEKSLKQSIEILEQLAEQFPDQGIIQIPLAKSRQQLGDLLRTTFDTDSGSVQLLERSRNELQSAIESFEKYVKVTQSNLAGRKGGHFNTLTLSNLYTSLAETLMRLELPELAEQARLKARHLQRPGPRPQ